MTKTIREGDSLEVEKIKIAHSIDDSRKIGAAALLGGLAGACFIALAFFGFARPSPEFYFFTIIGVILIAICGFLIKEMRKR